MQEAESKLTFKVGGLYRTRGGEIRRVVCVDAPGQWPVISVPLKSNHALREIVTHLEDGREFECFKDGKEDLMQEHHEPREWHLIQHEQNKRPQVIDGPGFEIGKVIRVREVIE